MSGNKGPNLIEDGLILYLDAANIKSYSGGSAWLDLSKTNYSASLFNGCAFTSDRGGGINFDGTNDYVSVQPITPFGTGDYCIEIITKIITINSNQYFFDFGVGLQGNSCALQYYAPSPGTNLLRFLTENTTINDTSYALNENEIYSFSIVRSSGVAYFFVNGEQINSWSDSENYFSNTIKLGDWGNTNEVSYGLAGNIYLFKVYNRALSNAQVAQNFNGVRSRFGI